MYTYIRISGLRDRITISSFSSMHYMVRPYSYVAGIIFWLGADSRQDAREKQERKKISEIISVRWLLLNVTSPRGRPRFFPRACDIKRQRSSPPPRRSRRFYERRYKKSPFASDPCGWSRINNDRMNFNTQLAFIPRAVIVGAKEGEARVGGGSNLLSKGQATSKDRWIDRSRYLCV